MLSANTAGFPGACKRTIGALAGPECTLGKYNNEGQDREPTAMRAARCGGGSIGYFKLLEAWRVSGELADLELTQSGSGEHFQRVRLVGFYFLAQCACAAGCFGIFGFDFDQRFDQR